MGTHRNVSLSQDLQRIFNFKLGDNISSEVRDIITPVVPISRIQHTGKNGSKTTTGNSTLYSAPDDEDFYLCMFALAANCNATSDCTEFLAYTYDESGTIIRLATLLKNTLTAFHDKVVIQFIPPLKIPRGQDIKFGMTFSAGSNKINGWLTGYKIR